MHLTDLAVAVSGTSVVYVSIDVIDWAVVFSSVDKAKAGPGREDVGLNKD